MASPQSAAPVSSGQQPLVRVVTRDGLGKTDLDCPPSRIAELIADPQATIWVDIEARDGDLGAVETLLAEVFHFHPLAIDDALQETHIPKLDDWSQFLYLVVHTIHFDLESHVLRLHELDLFLGRNYLITYHDEPMPPLDQIRRGLSLDSARLSRGADHLLYHVLDLVVADYLRAIEHLDEAIDDAQEEVFGAPTPQTLQRIFQVKRAALRLHRVIAPQREVVNRLARDVYAQIDAEDRVYFRDVYDHLVRLHDITESLRDLIAGALDTYLSAVSNRTNEIMKTLTLVTVMFLPMSFLAGFFGMNFFGESLAFAAPLPRGWLFWFTGLVMISTPVAMWAWARHRGWF